MNTSNYTIYIWFRSPSGSIMDDMKTAFEMLFGINYQPIVQIVSFEIELPNDLVTHKEYVKEALNFFYNEFKSSNPKVYTPIKSLKEYSQSYRILPGDRIFIKELNKCWECTETSWTEIVQPVKEV